jgi:hypothetical protein
MNTTIHNFKPNGIQAGKHLAHVAMLLFVLMFAQVAHATAYVTLNDGSLHIFPDSCVTSMTTDDGALSFTAPDGSVYRYSMDEVQSVSEELTKELPTITSFKFNNKYNFQIIGDAEGVITTDSIVADVVGIGKWLTASFSLSDDQAVAFVDGVEQQSKVSRMSYANDKAYTVGYPGDLILAPNGENGYALLPYGRTYTAHVNFLTDNNEQVPSIHINTVGGENISSRDYYLDAEIIIDGRGVFPSMTDSVQIKGRGHSSWSSDPDDKNPYRLKFNSKVKPLGLTKGKSWVLLANNISGSQLTNAIGMKAASLIGTVAANHIIPVDLYVNGVYKGSYNFTEKIGFSNNSIDLADESAATLLEVDINFDEEVGQKFLSGSYSLPVNVQEPTFSDTASTVLTLEKVRSRFNAFLSALKNKKNPTAYVDVDYLARFLMLNELICNFEIFHPKSVWCYNENILEDSCKFVFGPVWDFDWAFGFDYNRTYYRCDPGIDYYTVKPTMWQLQLMTDLRNLPEVTQRLYELWGDLLENGIDELCDYCTEYYAYASPSLWRNRYYIGDYTDYDEQSQYAATWLRNRVEAIYEKMKVEVAPRGDLNLNGAVDIDDLATLIDYLLGNETQVHTSLADVNTDGNVNIEDIATLIDKLLGNN